MEQAYAQGEKLRSLGEMAAAIAHEIRNPLASMSGCIEMLKADEEIAERGGHLLEIILKESDRLNKLITDFLVYARPDRVEHASVALSPLVSDLELMIRSEGTRTVLRTDVDSGLYVNGDAKRLHQMLWNVVKNATEAMGGTGEIRIAARRLDTRWVRLEISDDGTGMTPEVRDRIFDPFFTTKESGTGLGMAMVHRIIEGHEGRVFIDSAPGEGTCFRIDLKAEGVALESSEQFACADALVEVAANG